jgi:K+-transporting ATPase KdpF subunit
VIAVSLGDNVVGAVLAVLAVAYLVYVLVFPERF